MPAVFLFNELLAGALAEATAGFDARLRCGGTRTGLAADVTAGLGLDGSQTEGRGCTAAFTLQHITRSFDECFGFALRLGRQEQYPNQRSDVRGLRSAADEASGDDDVRTCIIRAAAFVDIGGLREVIEGELRPRLQGLARSLWGMGGIHSSDASASCLGKVHARAPPAALLSQTGRTAPTLLDGDVVVDAESALAECCARLMRAVAQEVQMEDSA